MEHYKKLLLQKIELIVTRSKVNIVIFIGIILAILFFLAFTITIWLPLFLNFIRVNSDAIQGITDFVQLIVWFFVALVSLLGFVMGYRNRPKNITEKAATVEKQELIVLPGRIRNFVDRLSEIQEIKNLLLNGYSVNISGLGGIGKTSLAIEVGYALVKFFPDGVFWLSVLDHPTFEDVLNAMATALGIDIPPLTTQDKKILIQKAIASKKLLIIIDNIEDLDLANKILDIKGNGEIIFTSRPPLDIPNTHMYNISKLGAQDSEKLFSLSVGRNLSDNEVALVRGKLSQILDGFPLAIELAAKLVHHQKVEVKFLVNNLERSDPIKYLSANRSKGVEEPLAYAFSSLDEVLKTVFFASCAFWGRTFDADAIKFVSKQSDALIHIHELISYSLVSVNDDRFSVHPLIKEYVCSKMTDNGFFLQALNYYLNYIKNQKSPERTLTEWSNIRGALEWSAQNGYSAEYIEMIRGLITEDAYFSFFSVYGYWSEAIVLITMGVDLAQKNNDQESLAIFMASIGLFHYWLGYYNDARKAYLIAEKILVRNKNIPELIQLYWNIGYIEDDEDNYELAHKYYDMSYQLSEKLKDAHRISVSRGLLGVVEYHRGKYELARDLLETSIREYHQRGDSNGEARIKRRLAAVLRKISDNKPAAEAENLLLRAKDLLIDCLRVEKNRRSIARALRQLGMVEQKLSRISDAQKSYLMSKKIFEEIGNKKGTASVLYNLGTVEEQAGNFREAENYYRESLKLVEDMNIMLGPAFCLWRLGMIGVKTGKKNDAISYLVQAESILKTIKSPYYPEIASILSSLQHDSRSNK